MGRSWDRYDASLEDIKRARKSILSQFSNATDIYYDEYLVDRHQNESCNANKFYYGAVMETKDGRFQAATSYGRIGDYNKAFGGIKAFDEGVFTNFDSAKRKLNEKLDKKKRGKRCSKCKTRQSYSPFAPKNAETFEAEKSDFKLYYIVEMPQRDYLDNFTTLGDAQFAWKYLPHRENYIIVERTPMNNKEKEMPRMGAETMSPQVFGKLAGQYPQPPNNPLPVGGFMDEGFEWTVNQAENEELVAFGNGWHHTPLDEVTETGHMVFKNFGNDEEVDVYYARRQANDKGIRTTPNSYIFYSKNNKPIENESFVMTAVAINREYGLKNMLAENEDYYCDKCDDGFSSITPTDEGQFCNNCLPDSATPHNEMDATTQKEDFFAECEHCDEKITTKSPYKCVHHKICKVCVKEFGSCPMCDSNRNFNSSSNIVSKVKDNWLNSLIGLGLGLVAFDFLKKKVYVANADTLIESPNTGDLTPADYEEIVVESTGYAVPIIPVSLDGSFMGSRFHALPTDRYVYDSPEGIGANIDVAMKRNTTFLPNEQSLVQASEAPGQSPYNSMQPNGQENTDFPLRVIHETTTVSLDPSTASFIPTDLSGYTGQQFVPTSVYEDMLGVGISGRIPSFSQPASGDIGSNHFGSRIANPDMLTNVGGPLKEDVNGDYTDGNITKSLSQWSIENQVQQISDTEAIVVERGSGGRKMIRRV